MRIFIDFGHPAHVHYFRNFMQIMESEGHTFFCTARDKECTFDLLDHFQIPYVDRGKGGEGNIGKLLYMLGADWQLYRLAKQFKPDVFLSFGSFYAAQASSMYGKPHISFDDTEKTKFGHSFYMPFSELALFPEGFKKDLGPKQERFKGLMESCYLHPNHFQKDEGVWEELGLEPGTPYFVIRFIAWGARHDVGHSGISDEVKKEAIEKLSKHGRVFISAEGSLDPEFEPYRLKIHPARIHHILASARLFFGESGTMATESALLGVPTVRVSTLAKLLGNFLELKEAGLLEFYDSGDRGLEAALRLASDPNAMDTWSQRRKEFLAKKIDVTAFMVERVKQFMQGYK